MKNQSPHYLNSWFEQTALPARKFAELSLSQAEKLMSFQYESSRSYLNLGLEQARAAFSATDAQSFQAWLGQQKNVVETVTLRMRQDAESLASIGRDYADAAVTIAGEGRAAAQAPSAPAAETAPKAQPSPKAVPRATPKAAPKAAAKPKAPVKSAAAPKAAAKPAAKPQAAAKPSAAPSAAPKATAQPETASKPATQAPAAVKPSAKPETADKAQPQAKATAAPTAAAQPQATATAARTEVASGTTSKPKATVAARPEAKADK